MRAADGTFTTFDAPHSSDTEPEAINAAGVVAGIYGDTQQVLHGFVRSSAGKITSFDPPNSTDTRVFGINKQGAIVGWFIDNNGVSHGFIRTP